MRCASVTPADGGALRVVQEALEDLGFVCTRLSFSEPGTEAIENLYARLGAGSPHFCFAGHTDVVPVGDRAAWSVDPFAGEVCDGHVVGRGAADMKGAIAAFIAATDRFLAHSETFTGSISLLITGDEEGPAINGTAKVLAWLKERGEAADHCLVGEPTNPSRLGEMIKIGRRGSLNAHLTVKGVQGHVAYPERADNPVPKLMAVLRRLTETPLDEGNAHFQPSHLEVVSVDVGNETFNLIPEKASARLNIRFNDQHSGASLRQWLHDVCTETLGKGAFDLDIAVSGEAFVSPPDAFARLIERAVVKKFGRPPELSTSGGTSDARFLKDMCPVAEFGLVGATMHKVDESAAIQDIEDLTDIYTLILKDYFAR